MIKKIIWTLVFLAISLTYSDASMAGNSKTLEWLTISVVSIIFIYFLMVWISKFIHKFKKVEPAPRPLISDSLAGIEPYLSNIFRILVLVMLCTVIDKLDNISSDIGTSTNNISSINELSENIKSSLESIDEKIDNLEGDIISLDDSK
jgi:predicted PurR-regulated permease PerM